jgi:hypothetical protein
MRPRIWRPSHRLRPLRSRIDIAAYLDDVGGYRSAYGRDGRSYFAFNVKCHGVDLDFDHLVAVYRGGGYYGDGETWLDNPEWLTPARARYAEVEPHLFAWGVAEAARLVTETDGYNHLDDGTPIDVTYTWMGRSGGYLGIARFEDFDFTQAVDRAVWRAVFQGNPHRPGSAAASAWARDEPAMGYAALRRLHALVARLAHDLTPARAAAEVEHQAAFQFVENGCADIPRFRFTQALLPLGV